MDGERFDKIWFMSFKLFMMSMFNCMDQLTVLLSWFIHYHVLTLLLHMIDG